MILFAALLIVFALWVNHTFLSRVYRDIMRGVHGDPDEEIS